MYDHHVIPAMPFLHLQDPGIRQFQELHAGGAVGGVEVDISRGTMGIIPGLYVTVADNAANKYLIPNHLAINPKYHDPKKIYEEFAN